MCSAVVAAKFLSFLPEVVSQASTANCPMWPDLTETLSSQIETIFWNRTTTGTGTTWSSLRQNETPPYLLRTSQSVRRCFGLLGDRRKKRMDGSEPPFLCFGLFPSLTPKQIWKAREGDVRAEASQGRKARTDICVAGLVLIQSVVSSPKNLLIHFPSSTIWDCRRLSIFLERDRSIDLIERPPFLSFPLL